MITCPNCATAQNPKMEKINPSIPNPQPTYDMPNLVKQLPSMPSSDTKTLSQSSPYQSSPYQSSPYQSSPYQSEEEANIYIPDVVPGAPFFTVPNNPLLPDGYQEVLDYNSLQYMNGFLRTQIGKTAEVEFLVGSNKTVVHTGRLVGVGINYIILQEFDTDSILTCDFYNIKFVRFYE